MRIETIIKLERKFADQVTSLYDNALRFQWDMDFIRDGMKTIYESEDYRRLPRYAHTYIAGVRDHADRILQRELVFSYDIDGKRLAIDSDEYRKVSPEKVCKLHSDSGAFVYKADTTKICYPTQKGTE